MRFLDMHIDTPESGRLKIVFSEGVNILAVSDANLFSFMKQNTFYGISGPCNDEVHGDTASAPRFIDISAATPHGILTFVNDRGKFSVQENKDEQKNNGGDNSHFEHPGGLSNGYAIHELNLISLFDPVLILGNSDPVFDTEAIKSFFINTEFKRNDSGLVTEFDNILKLKEKERTELNREAQLLELRLKKREKLTREVEHSERDLHRLERQREAMLKYKSAINGIKVKTEERDRLSSRINNMKKNLIEYREIQSKADLTESKLRQQFPGFFQKGPDQLPYLKNIQESFNKYRDVNEQIDGFYMKKRRFSAVLVKIIQSVSFFSLISALFILVKPETLPVIGIVSGSAAGTAILLFLVSCFKIRKGRPLELLERKKDIENDLVKIIEKNNFNFDSSRTGEIYELLFQYFTDYISFRDMTGELEELKMKIPDSLSLQDKEEKLDKLIRNQNDIGDNIKEMFESLDESVHACPSEDGIGEIIYDLDEMLEENAKDISHKKDLITKFVNEIAEHDKTENSSLSVENALDHVMKKTDECISIIEHIHFLNKVLKDAADEWALRKIETLIRISSGHFLRFTNGSFRDNDLSDLFKNFILNSGMINNEYMEYIHSISLSVKTAIYEMFSGEEFPPFFIIDPFSVNDDFTENLKKLLPELFPGRQVIILMPEGSEKLEGNLISI